MSASDAALQVAALHRHMSSCPDPVTARSLLVPAIEAMQLWLSSVQTSKRPIEALTIPAAAKRTKLSTDEEPVSPILRLSPELQLGVMQWLDAAFLGRVEACCRLFWQPRRSSVVQEAVAMAMRRKYQGQQLCVRTWPRLLRLHEEMEEVLSRSRASGDLVQRLLDIRSAAGDEAEDEIKADPYRLTRVHQVPQSMAVIPSLT